MRTHEGVYFLVSGPKIKGVSTTFATAIALATRLGLDLYHARKIETLLPATRSKKAVKRKRGVA